MRNKSCDIIKAQQNDAIQKQIKDKEKKTWMKKSIIVQRILKKCLV